MNKIILTGNLGHSASVRDVEKPDHSGTTPVVNFSLAVRDGYGEREVTHWYGCSWWGERAAKVAEWLTRGRRVLVEGSPSVRLWEKRDRSGWGAEIVVRVANVELLDSGRDEAPNRDSIENNDTSRGDAPAGNGAAKPAAKGGPDEDVPF